MTQHPITRRQALVGLTALTAGSQLLGQQSAPPIRVRFLSHATLTVSDRKRSLEFYQGLFGLPIGHRQDVSMGLRIGAGPQYISLSQGASGARPRIGHFCMTIDSFSVTGVTSTLAAHGLTSGDPGPLKTWVRTRGPEAGGAKEGTPEFYLGDPDGINVQFQDVSYCGGAGVLGNICIALEPVPSKGLIALENWSHFTLSVSDSRRSTDFYKRVFGLPVAAYQGAMEVLGVGSQRQFLAMGGLQQSTPGIGHGCFTMRDFNPNRVMKTLSEFGLKPRGTESGPAKPLVYYISTRMEDRGGAKEGTPELYFTDPDGIVMQIQDVSYCGGSGYLGNICRS